MTRNSILYILSNLIVLMLNYMVLNVLIIENKLNALCTNNMGVLIKQKINYRRTLEE